MHRCCNFRDMHNIFDEMQRSAVSQGSGNRPFGRRAGREMQ